MDLGEKIEKITIDLTSVLGVVGTKDENNVVSRVFEIFSEMDYFKTHTDNLKYVDVINDKLDRKSVLATIKGEKRNSNKTVVLIGHTDTVGISDYGELKE